jgi:hypothetical protein
LQFSGRPYGIFTRVSATFKEPQKFVRKQSS